MTTLITRVFPNASDAQRAVNSMSFFGMPNRNMTILSGGDDAADRLAKAGVDDSAVAAYAKALAAGQTALVIKATYKPLGAAKMAREVLGRHDDTADMGNVVEERKLPWEPDHAPSVLKDHPHMMTVPGLPVPGNLSEAFGIPTLKTGARRKKLTSHDRRMSRAFWPMPLLKTNRNATSAKGRRGAASRMFWPMPLLSKGERRKSVIPGGAHPFSRLFGMRLLS